MHEGSFTLARLSGMSLALLLISCAGQVAPPGGPPDTIPPVIIRTEPDSNAVGVHPQQLVLEFSEYVDRRSVEESIFLSPDLGALEFDWSGRELEISFSEPLRDSVTYVLNVGTDVVDIRAGNRMAHGFSLAFSTGPRIDMGAISGTIDDPSPEGVYVFAYRLEGRDPDTLNPARAHPDYITQSGKGGAFVLSHLAEGRYRIVAVRDQYKNLLYDRQVDAYGVGREDYWARETPDQGIWFRLAREDTTRPFLTSATPVGGRQVKLHFSEPLDSISVEHTTVELEDTLSGDELPVLSVFPVSPGWSDLGVLLGQELGEGRAYRATAHGATDTAHNPLDRAHASAVFLGTGEPDTVLPQVEFAGLSDSSHHVLRNATFLLAFSEPIDTQSALAALTLSDTSDGAVAFAHRWRFSTRLLLTPLAPLRDAFWYSLAIGMNALTDAALNTAADTVVVVHFLTLDPRQTGEITGVVLERPEGDPGGPLQVEVLPLTRSGAVAEQVVPRPGPFSLQEVREGRYRLWAFEDADSSGTYSYGLPYPFVPSERFTVYGDTLRVRARWTVENAELLLGP